MNFDLEAAKAMLRKNEGVRTHVYNDILGIPTVGVGFNLKRSDARDRMTQVGASYSRVSIGMNGLTCEQIENLLEMDVSDCLRDLRQLVKSFDAMPGAAQLVLIDMRYNLGYNGLKRFKDTLAALERGDFATAAEHIAKTPYARQVGVRASRNCAALKRLGDERKHQ